MYCRQLIVMLMIIRHVMRRASAFTSRNLLALQEGRIASTSSVARRASVSGIVYESNVNTSDVTVKLFTKEGCTLCDKVKDVLFNIREEHPHTLVAVDISDDDKKEFREKYKYDIPVLHLNDKYFAKHKLSREEAILGITACREGKFASPAGDPNAAAMERS